MIRPPLVVQLVSVAAAVGVAALAGLGGLLDRAVHDRLTRLLERPYAGPAVIVAIDQGSLRELEGWPWPRSRHAALIDRLTAAGARVIALDIDFSSSSDAAQDSALAGAIHRSGRVVLAAFKEERALSNGLALEYANVPLPLLAEGAAAVGSILIPVDPDGAVRRASLRDTIAGEPVHAFGLEAARLAAGVPAERLAALAEGGDLWLDFTAGRPPVVPYADVLAGRVPGEAFRGRIVFVGATALELQDFRPTPLGPITSGVQIQAHVADTLLRGGGPRRVGGTQAGLAAVGLALPALLVARGRRRVAGLVLAGLPAIVGLGMVVAAAPAGVRLPAGAFVVAGLATMLAHGIGAWAELAREVARVRARLATLAEFGRRADPSRGPAQSVEIVLEVVRELLGLAAVEVRLADGSTIRPPSAGDGAVRSGNGVEVPLVASGRVLGQLAATMPEGRSVGPDERALLEAIASRVAVDSENRSLAADLRSIHLSVIHSLAVAIEMRNAYTGQHCEGVAQRAAEIARMLGLDADQVERIRIGGLLHDIGKIGVPESILLKPGRFTPEEYEVMKQHSAIGHKIIGSLPFPDDVKNYVRHHHERYDGTGYPDGLGGEALSLGARIVAVADCYEAFVTDRPYRPRVTAREAFGYIKQHRGTHYDPAVVDTLEAILRARGEAID